MKHCVLERKRNFFLYIDIESLILNDQNKAYLYEQELKSGSSNMLEEYKEYLWSGNSADISKIPSKFFLLLKQLIQTLQEKLSLIYILMMVISI